MQDPNHQASKIIFDTNLTQIKHSSKIISSPTSFLSNGEIENFKTLKSFNLDNASIFQQVPSFNLSNNIEIKRNSLFESSMGEAFDMNPQQKKIHSRKTRLQA